MDETKLKGKKIVGVFGWEEYEKQDGTIGVATKLTQIRSLDKLNEIKIPKVKLIDGTYMEYEDYKNRSSKNATSGSTPVEIAEDSLPFEI